MNQKQISVLAGFTAAGVDYAVVGGVAVNWHGFIRATNDLDIFIRPTEENAQVAYDALLVHGVLLDGIEAGDLSSDGDHVRFGTEDYYVDILTSIGEMPFDQVWRNRVEAQVEDVTVLFISKNDLIENKLQVGRLRDLVDVEELARIPNREP